MRKKSDINNIINYIIPIIILLITLITFYPGVFSYDGNNQWQQVQNGVITNAHPFFSTYFMYLLSKIYNSITTIMIFQILLFSVSWGYFCSLIRIENQKLNFVKIAFTILLCLVPLIGIYNITLWKDIIYTDYLFLISIITYSLTTDEFKTSTPKYIMLGLLLALVYSYRHNGMIVAMILLLIFCIICIKKYSKGIINKYQLLKMVLTPITFILVILLISIPKTKYLNKSNQLLKENNNQSYSFIDSYVVWMMGAHLTDNNIKNKNDLNILNNVIPIEEWKKTYNAYLINFTGDAMNKKYVSDHYLKLRKIFIKYTLKKPMTIVKHYLKADAIIINPVSSLNGYVYTYSFPELQYLPKYTRIKSKIPTMKRIYNKTLEISLKKPFIIFYQPAFILYLCLIMGIFLSKKVYGKKIWIFLLPMLANTISLLPINLAQDLRYVYINYLTFFGLLLMFILNADKIFVIRKNRRV